jgi:hypothetical protein
VVQMVWWSTRTFRCAPVASAIAVAGVLAGCAGGGGGTTGGDPGAKSLPPGSSCQSVKVELDRLVNSGVQSSVEAQSAGRKLAPAQKAQADRYNQLLEQYLGARCHV